MIRKIFCWLSIFAALTVSPVVNTMDDLLLPHERDWLSSHPVIRVAFSPDYQPIAFIDDQGKPQGMVADYLALIEQRLDIRFEVVVPSPEQQTNNDPNEKGVDVVSVFAITPERQEFWQYTKHYLNLPLYLIVKESNKDVANLTQFNGRTLAVVKSYAAVELLEKNYPQILLRPVSSTREGLYEIAFGNADAFISDLPTASWWVTDEVLSRLRVAGTTDLHYDLAMAARKDKPELHGILEKGLAAITNQEREAIFNRWIRIPMTPDKQMHRAFVVALSALGVIAIGLLLTLFWNRQLKRQVDERTAKLSQLFNRMELQHKAIVSMTFPGGYEQTGLQHALAHICSLAAKAMNASRVSVWIFSEDGQDLVCLNLFDTRTMNHSQVEVLQKNQFPCYFAALKSLRAVDAHDVYQDVRTLELSDYAKQSDVHSLLDAAIRVGGKLAGVVCIEQCEKPREWTPDEVSFTGAVADQAAQAYVYAQLLEHQTNLEHLVTERTAELEKVNRELLLSKELAESADRIKTMFVASMSHELRTPLNSIIGFTDIVLKGMSGELNTRQQDQLSRVLGSAKHLLSLISDVIDVSKIEAGYIDVHLETFSLLSLCNEVLTHILPSAQKKNLQVILDCPTDLLLNSDRKRVYQIILNLLSNAVKYSEKGFIELSATIVEDGVNITVKDQGIGMDEAALKRIFAPFERIDSRLKINTPGTGLGLYLTRKIIDEILLGTISVQSQPDVGSTFSVWLPTQPQNSSISRIREALNG